MAVYQVDKYRNIALVGHVGSGKTSLAEALLFKAGVTNRLGSVPDKTSILDFTDEERDRGSSLDSAVAYLTHGDLHVNIVDTPGTMAFCGPAIAALAGVELAVIAVSASAGIQVNTRKMLQRARDYGLGVWFVITHIDAANADLPGLLAAIQESFGPECVPINLPASGGKSFVDCFKSESGDSDFGSVEDAHTGLIEAVVGADEELMEKYLGGELSDAEAVQAAAKAVSMGECMPVFFVDSCHDVGVAEFLDALGTFAPNPLVGKKRVFLQGEDETEIEPNQDGPLLGQVFKVTTGPAQQHQVPIATGVLRQADERHESEDRGPL